jgi:hypothetical protein
MFKPGQVIECDTLSEHGKPVVAVIGQIHDWTAYEQSYAWQITPDAIAAQGDKISQNEARKLFPELSAYPFRS